MTALPGAICAGCKIDAVEWFVCGASHAQPATLSAREEQQESGRG